jgi:hypothetical protein
MTRGAQNRPKRNEFWIDCTDWRRLRGGSGERGA